MSIQYDHAILRPRNVGPHSQALTTPLHQISQNLEGKR